VDGVIAWSGFLGAWLLVAGPVYQAYLELKEQEFERERFTAAGTGVPEPPRVSGWWWLLPPVKYLLERRRSAKWRDAMLAALPHDELENLVNFLNKARGWLYVGLGGFLIATKETWELHEHYEWPQYAFWLLMLGMALLAVTNLAVMAHRSRSVLASF
jgi:hypothetical protein